MEESYSLCDGSTKKQKHRKRQKLEGDGFGAELPEMKDKKSCEDERVSGTDGSKGETRKEKKKKEGKKERKESAEIQPELEDVELSEKRKRKERKEAKRVQRLAKQHEEERVMEMAEYLDSEVEKQVDVVAEDVQPQVQVEKKKKKKKSKSRESEKMEESGKAVDGDQSDSTIQLVYDGTIGVVDIEAAMGGKLESQEMKEMTEDWDAESCFATNAAMEVEGSMNAYKPTAADNMVVFKPGYEREVQPIEGVNDRSPKTEIDPAEMDPTKMDLPKMDPLSGLPWEDVRDMIPTPSYQRMIGYKKHPWKVQYIVWYKRRIAVLRKKLMDVVVVSAGAAAVAELKEMLAEYQKNAAEYFED